MIRVEARSTIRATPREILEFVLDLDRYRQADGKILRVRHQPTVNEDQRTGRARYRGVLRGLRTPSQWQIVTLEPWTSVSLRTEPGQWTARFASFEGGFTCMPIDERTTELAHYEQFDFRALSPVADRLLGGWLQDYIDEIEMPQLTALIEAG